MLHYSRVPGATIYIITACIIFLLACNRSTDIPGAPSFSKVPEAHRIYSLALQEASGMADSKANPGYLWVLEDSGNPPFIYLMKHDGTVVKPVFVGWAWNWDWEDFAISSG